MNLARQSISIRSHVAGRVLVVTVAGILTLESSGAMRRRVLELLQATVPAAIVLDVRGALHVMMDDDWEELARRSAATFSMQLPVASVVTEGEFPGAQLHAVRMSRLGFSRRAFCSFSEAMDWASRRGGYWSRPSAQSLSAR